MNYTMMHGSTNIKLSTSFVNTQNRYKNTASTAV